MNLETLISPVFAQTASWLIAWQLFNTILVSFFLTCRIVLSIICQKQSKTKDTISC